MENTKNITIDFLGYYHSFHSDTIDGQIESFEIDWETVDFKATNVDHAYGLVNRINNELDLNLKFIGLDSPRFYNYRTDRLELGVNAEDEKTIIAVWKNEEFQHWANPKLTSCDGFVSYYDGVNDLINRANANEEDYLVLLQMCLEWLIDDNEIEDNAYDIEFEIITK